MLVYGGIEFSFSHVPRAGPHPLPRTHLGLDSSLPDLGSLERVLLQSREPLKSAEDQEVQADSVDNLAENRRDGSGGTDGTGRLRLD